MSGEPREDGLEKDEDDEEEVEEDNSDEEEEPSEEEEEVESRVSAAQKKRGRSKGSTGERNIHVESMVRSLQQEGELKGTILSSS